MEPSQIKAWIDQLSPQEQALLEQTQRLADEIGPHLILEQVYLALDLLCETLQALMPEIPCPTGCSRCCTSPPSLTSEEAKLIQEMFPEIAYASQETCGFLKHGKCQIYAARPLDCRAKGYFFEQPEQALPMFQQAPQPWTCTEESQRWKTEIQALENPVKFMFLPLVNHYRQLVEGIRKPMNQHFQTP